MTLCLDTCASRADRHSLTICVSTPRTHRSPPAILKLSDVRSNIAELVNRVHYRGERVIIGRSGKELAALIPMRDLELLEHLIEEAEDRLDVAEADRITADEPTSIAWEEVRRESSALDAPQGTSGT